MLTTFIFWPVDIIIATSNRKKPDGHIHVKVEFGEGEGKVPIDEIAKRAKKRNTEERVTYKMIQEYVEKKYRKNFAFTHFFTHFLPTSCII